MPSSEFDLIHRYFAAHRIARRDVLVGIGDDAAVVQVPGDMALATSVDTLVAGVHFQHDAQADAVGHKALAAGLSDMAAMGAEPAWAVLALTLPEADETWVAGFCRGLFALADEHGVALVGGDTTRGPLSATVTVQGLVSPEAGFYRGAARVGDTVCVTGTLGDAGLALRLAAEGRRGEGANRVYLNDRLDRPSPRIGGALRMRGLVRAAIDVSDGLVADLGHILEASGVGATVLVDRLPLSPAFRACSNDIEQAVDLALAAGDDYELCFTIGGGDGPALEKVMADAACPWTPIGTIEAERGLRLIRDSGASYEGPLHGYDHFATR